ncbi:cytochrome c [Chitinophaga sp.]|uniref:cytochrome c n=1 Tax=Chitinophaga sp. TaxID=1869181 RepID=UPI002F93C9F5
MKRYLVPFVLIACRVCNMNAVDKVYDRPDLRAEALYSGRLDPFQDDLPARIKNGKNIFMVNCAACHSTTNKRLTGPPLGHVTARRPRSWLEKYIINNAKVKAGGDKYANKLSEEYNRAGMPIYVALKGKPLDDLLLFLENDSKSWDREGYDLIKRRADSIAAHPKRTTL